MKRHPIKLQIRGMGDIVHALAAPVARVIDRIAGTDLEHCAACARRREKLNHLTRSNPKANS